MSYVLVKVYCPHCATPNVKKNGVKANGQQNFYCKECRRQFQFEYKYPGADPRVKRKVCEMAMNGTGLAHQRHPRHVGIGRPTGY